MTVLLRRGRPKARTEHRCSCCSGAIVKGERHEAAAIVDDGRVYTWRTCDSCRGITTAVWRWVDPLPDEGVTAEDYVEWATCSTEHPEWGDAARAYLARRGGASDGE